MLKQGHFLMNPEDTDYNWIDRLPEQVKAAVQSTM